MIFRRKTSKFLLKLRSVGVNISSIENAHFFQPEEIFKENQRSELSFNMSLKNTLKTHHNTEIISKT